MTDNKQTRFSEMPLVYAQFIIVCYFFAKEDDMPTLLAVDALAITPTRNLNLLYIILDSIFILVFLCLLIWKKRYSTALFALFGGVIYTIVDYGGFYLLSHTRTVYIDGQLAGAGGTFWVLLWMSMSYGITNFAFIWVCVNRDSLLKYWLFLIIMWWLICPSICELGGEATITTSRTTGAYHGWMGVVLVVSYFILIVLLMKKEGQKAFVNVLVLCLIGFSVQFCWEFSLLVNGIRPLNDASLRTLIVNSCLETNLGMPAIFAINYFWKKRFNEDMSRARPATVQPDDIENLQKV